ncbi:MAG TPA: transglycosylase SLT domain-containing protein [Solirubrobacteraceae bacterium]|nr:transglycosylase SLT domain-containing protein [Solirubrobacteraceae bacterium]
MATDYRAAARKAARRVGLDPNIFERQINQESGFAEDVITGRRRSSAGALGIAQIMPATARGWGVDPLDPIAALNVAAKNMARYVKQFGSYRDALVAYNAGPGRVGGALPAETQNYIQTILGGRNPTRLADPSSAPSGPSSSPTETPEHLGYDPGASQVDLTSFAKLLQPRPKPTATAPVAPAFAARAPGAQTAYKTPGASPAPKQRFDQGAAVEALQTLAQTSEGPSSTVVKGKTSSSTTQTPPTTPTESVGWPTAKKGDLIGAPHQGTHTLGNWQSDNAIDIGVPVGTPMVALQSGVVVKVTKHPQGSGRFAGDQITIRGANGNEYFYAHGVADVKAGQKIRRGQELGTTGSANGVAHLHFGQMKGDPRAHTR